MTDDSSIVTGSTGQSTTITNLFFNVAHNGTFRDRGQRQDITNVQGGLLTAVEELASVHTFGSNESFGTELVPELSE
jgi:hypothetical protein